MLSITPEQTVYPFKPINRLKRVARSLTLIFSFTGNKKLQDFSSQIATAYKQLLSNAKSWGSEWIQIDEPALVLDMAAEDKALFSSLYKTILENKEIKVLLQTYFGDVRDFYKELLDFDFDGLGLDFVGSKSDY